MMVRRTLLGAALLLPALAWAQDSGPAAPVAALAEGLTAVRKAGRATPFAQRAAMLGPVVQRSFALQEVLRASVGPRFNSIPAAEQATLLQVFTEYTVDSYVSNFDSDTGDRFVVSPDARPVGSDQVVSTRLVDAKGGATKLDYVVRQEAGGWQIVDVLIDGSISQVAVQRSDFRSLLSGGSAARLIASLRAKSAAMAAGEKR